MAKAKQEQPKKKSKSHPRANSSKLNLSGVKLDDALRAALEVPPPKKK